MDRQIIQWSSTVDQTGSGQFILHLVHGGYPSSVEQHAFCEGRLARVNVCRDTNVSNLLHIQLANIRGGEGERGRGGEGERGRGGEGERERGGEGERGGGKERREDRCWVM